MLFLLLSLFSMGIIAILGYYISEKSLKEAAVNKLTNIRNTKRLEVNRYLNSLKNLAICIGENKSTVEAFEKYDEAYNYVKVNAHPDSIYLKTLKQLRDSFFYSSYIKTMGSLAIDKNQFSQSLPQNKEALILQNNYNNLSSVKDPFLSLYTNALANYDTVFKSFVQHTEFGGLLLISSQTGDIVYTDDKLSELGGNVLTDSLLKTNLAELFKKLRYSSRETVDVIDFKEYFPANHLLKSFMGCPIIKNGKNIGVMALRLPIDTINKIMTYDSNWEENGLGKTGEVYLFGNKLMLRSQSRFFIEDPEVFFETLRHLNYNENDINYISRTHSTLKNIKIETKATTDAIKGISATNTIKDYRGTDVITSYAPVDFNGLHWGIVAQIDTKEAYENIEVLKRFMMIGFVIVFITVVLIAILIAGFITKPISELTVSAKEISIGNYQNLIKTYHKDEIGLLAESFNDMQQKITLLISNLKSTNHALEEKRKEITDSINYARKIQENVLADPELLNENLPNHFVYFNPKDVVSGDFYWAVTVEDEQTQHDLFYLAVCDSTGHGVPGAFMSLLNVSFLNEAIAIKGLRDPADILNYVRSALSKAMSSEANKDGMDGVLLCYHKSTNKVFYSGAFNKPIFIRNNQVVECDVNRMPIGKSDHKENFTTYELDMLPNDKLYLYSDGFADQFGGSLNKKYKNKNLNSFLKNNSKETAALQHKLLKDEFENWRSHNDQVDDVLVVGIMF
ncbi:MAG: SpoIIE family protein phosphatase [Bacteroidota bacterium]